jgi:hypothetical protein
MPVVLHGCENLTSREECRLRVLENRVLRRAFGPKRDEETRAWRELHNEELNDLYSSPTVVRVIKSRMRWAGHVARIEKRDSAPRSTYEVSNTRINPNVSTGKPGKNDIDLGDASSITPDIVW